MDLRDLPGKAPAFPTAVFSGFFWGHWLNNSFPFGFLRTKKEMKYLCPQSTGCWDPYTVFSSLITGGLDSKPKRYVFRVHPCAEEQSRWWRRWDSLAGFAWRDTLIQGPYRDEGWGCRARDWFPSKEPCPSSMVLEVTASFRWCGFVCIRVGVWSMCEPMWCDCEPACVSVCVFPQEIFPSYTAQFTCQQSSSALHTVCTLPCSSLNTAVAQIWLIFLFLRRRWCRDKCSKLLTS